MVIHALDVLGHGLLGGLIDGSVDVLVTENSSRRHLVLKDLCDFSVFEYDKEQYCFQEKVTFARAKKKFTVLLLGG